MFLTAVVEYGFTYDRFCEDFINSRTFHDAADADSRNDHKVNLGRIGSLLSTRDDLVRKYCETSMGTDEFRSCMKEFLLQKPKTSAWVDNFDCYLSTETLKVIADAANDIPLFQRPVSTEDMRHLFNDCVADYDSPLIANSNGALAYFLRRLNYSAIISNRYQKVLAVKRLVLTSRGRSHFTQSGLSSALCFFESTDNPIRSRIDKWVVLIKKASIAAD